MRLARTMAVLAVGVSISAAATVAALADDPVAEAKAFMEKVSKPNPPWNGRAQGRGGQDDRLCLHRPAQRRRPRRRRRCQGSRRKDRLEFPPHRRTGLGQRPLERPRSGHCLEAGRHRPRRHRCQRAGDGHRGSGQAGNRPGRLAFLCQVRSARYAADLLEHHHRPARGCAGGRLLSLRRDGRQGRSGHLHRLDL